MLCDRKAPVQVKGRLYKTMVRPAMLYGMESLPLTKKEEQKMEVAEMKMLRFTYGVTKMDQVRNEVVRGKLQVGEFSGKVRERRLQWKGHVLRREQEYVGKRVQRMSVGKRKKGRPRRRWRDCVKEDMEVVGVREEDAMDRGRWRRLVHTGNPT